MTEEFSAKKVPKTVQCLSDFTLLIMAKSNYARQWYLKVKQFPLHNQVKLNPDGSDMASIIKDDISVAMQQSSVERIHKKLPAI